MVKNDARAKTRLESLAAWEKITVSINTEETQTNLNRLPSRIFRKFRGISVDLFLENSGAFPWIYFYLFPWIFYFNINIFKEFKQHALNS